MAKSVTLVSPNRKDKREVDVDSKQDIQLRWDGWTPEAPRPEAPKPSGVGSGLKA